MSRLPRRVAALLLGLLMEVGAEARAALPWAPHRCASRARTMLGAERGAVPRCPRRTIWENPKGRAGESHSLADLHKSGC